jgi:hypothetical protein
MGFCKSSAANCRYETTPAAGLSEAERQLGCSDSRASRRARPVEGATIRSLRGNTYLRRLKGFRVSAFLLHNRRRWFAPDHLGRLPVKTESPGIGGAVERLVLQPPVIATKDVFAGQFRGTELGRQGYLLEKPQAVVAGRAL